MTYFAPSILAADFSNLHSELQRVREADYLHLDVMDGRFVPNITFGPGLIKSIRPHSSLVFDTHLMIVEPEKYIEDFARAGSDIITFHAEAVKHLDRVIHQVKETGCQVGVAINPATPLNKLEMVLSELDQVLIMSVNPGFGGQSLIPYTLKKIAQLRHMIDDLGLPTKIQIDGGVHQDNVREVVDAGTDIIVAGSAIFKKDNPAQALKEMRKAVGG